MSLQNPYNMCTFSVCDFCGKIGGDHNAGDLSRCFGEFRYATGNVPPPTTKRIEGNAMGEQLSAKQRAAVRATVETWIGLRDIQRDALTRNDWDALERLLEKIGEKP